MSWEVNLRYEFGLKDQSLWGFSWFGFFLKPNVSEADFSNWLEARPDISAMSEGFIGKVEITAKGLDGEDFQLIFVRKQKKEWCLKRGHTIAAVDWENILSIRRPNTMEKEQFLLGFFWDADNFIVLFNRECSSPVHPVPVRNFDMFRFVFSTTSSYQHPRYLEQILAKGWE